MNNSTNQLKLNLKLNSISSQYLSTKSFRDILDTTKSNNKSKLKQCFKIRVVSSERKLLPTIKKDFNKRTIIHQQTFIKKRKLYKVQISKSFLYYYISLEEIKTGQYYTLRISNHVGNWVQSWIKQKNVIKDKIYKGTDGRYLIIIPMYPFQRQYHFTKIHQKPSINTEQNCLLTIEQQQSTKQWDNYIKDEIKNLDRSELIYENFKKQQ